MTSINLMRLLVRMTGADVPGYNHAKCVDALQNPRAWEQFRADFFSVRGNGKKGFAKILSALAVVRDDEWRQIQP